MPKRCGVLVYTDSWEQFVAWYYLLLLFFSLFWFLSHSVHWCHPSNNLLIVTCATCIPFQSEWLLSFNMADCYKPQDIEKLLAGQHVVFLGDSVTRAIYKVANLDSSTSKDCWIKVDFSGLCLVGQWQNADSNGAAENHPYANISKYRGRQVFEHTQYFIWHQSVQVWGAY